MNAPQAAPDTSADVADREIVLTREFAAPRELVFRAWTEPEHFPRWFGPDGFTITLHEMDVRPGGRARYMMHGPDGTDYPNRLDYQEVVRPERLVYLLGDDVSDEPHAEVTVRFDVAEGGGTRVTNRMLFPTAAERGRVEAFGAVELGYQTLGRLAAYLEAM